MIKLVTGKNGIGKTYNLFWDNQNKNVSFCSQQIYTLDVSVKEYLEYGHTSISSNINEELATIGINNLSTKLENLSGGQRQFIHVLSCLENDTDMYIFDEPTNNLDNENTEKIWNLFLKYSSKEIKIITHDPRLLSYGNINIDQINLNEIEEHTIECYKKPQTVVKQSKPVFNKSFIKNKLKKDQDMYFYPMTIVIIAFTIIMLLNNTFRNDIYEYINIPENIAYSSQANNNCEYNMFVTGQEQCEFQIKTQNIEEAYLNIVEIAKKTDAEHLLISNGEYLEKVYKSMENGNVIQINTYSQLDEVDYSTFSELCTSSNILEGAHAKDNTQFTAGSAYMIDKYSDAEIGKEYDGKTYVGINKNNVVCSVSDQAEKNWYIDLMDEKQFKEYMSYIASFKEESIVDLIDDITYIGSSPDAFVKEYIKLTDISTFSKKVNNNYLFKLNIRYYIVNICLVLLGVSLFQLWYSKYLKNAASQQYANTIHLGFKSMQFEQVLKIQQKAMISAFTLFYITGFIILIVLKIDISLKFVWILLYPICVLYIKQVNKMIKNVI